MRTKKSVEGVGEWEKGRKLALLPKGSFDPAVSIGYLKEEKPRAGQERKESKGKTSALLPVTDRLLGG